MSPASKPTAVDRIRRGSPAEQARAPRTVTGDVRVKPVRVTVDFTPRQYEFLRDFAHDHRLGHSQLIRVLVDELARDPKLAKRIFAGPRT